MPRITINSGASLTILGTLTVSAPPASVVLPSLLAHWDFSDVSTLFQNASATTAVTTDGDRIGAITDKSGSGYTLKQPSDNARPTYQENFQNGLDAVDTTGSPAQYMEVNISAWQAIGNIPEPWSIFGVARTGPANPPELFSERLIGGVGSASGQVALGIGPNTGPTFNGGFLYGDHNDSDVSVLFASSGAWAKNTWYVWSMHSTGATFSVYVDNVFDLSRASQSLTQGFRLFHDRNLGSNGQGNWASDAGEFRIYASSMSDEQRTAVHDALATKWGV